MGENILWKLMAHRLPKVDQGRQALLTLPDADKSSEDFMRIVVEAAVSGWVHIQCERAVQVMKKMIRFRLAIKAEKATDGANKKKTRQDGGSQSLKSFENSIRRKTRHMPSAWAG